MAVMVQEKRLLLPGVLCAWVCCCSTVTTKLQVRGSVCLFLLEKKGHIATAFFKTLPAVLSLHNAAVQTVHCSSYACHILSHHCNHNHPFLCNAAVRARALTNLAECLEVFRTLLGTAAGGEEEQMDDGNDVRNVAEGFLLALCGGPVLSMQVRVDAVCVFNAM